MAEIMGRDDGYCRGRSGPHHVSARALGVALTSTIVGGELALTPGVALPDRPSGALHHGGARRGPRIGAAIAFAEASPFPSAAALEEHVYA
jgi:TPP-dependent pyruvate/acetoin dehydrogenase alpha subunit